MLGDPSSAEAPTAPAVSKETSTVSAKPGEGARGDAPAGDSDVAALPAAAGPAPEAADGKAPRVNGKVRKTGSCLHPQLRLTRKPGMKRFLAFDMHLRRT